MSIETQHRPNVTSQRSSVDYASLREGALTEPHQKTAELDPAKADYARSVADIIKSYDYYRNQKTSMSEAVAGLHEIYCENLANQTQRQFNELIIETVPAFRNRAKIDEKNLELDLRIKAAKEQNKSVPDLREKRSEISCLVARVCEYDHTLTDVVAAGRQTFGRGDIVNWIAATAGGTEKAKVFARRSVNGVVSELAVMDALIERPGEYLPAFTSIHEDLSGVDIAVYDESQSDQSYFTIDVKTSGSNTEPYWRNDDKGGHPHLIVRVDPGTVEGLHVDSKVRHGIRQQIQSALVIANNRRDTLGQYESPRQAMKK